MAKNEQQKPKSILEALGTRGEETGPEPTTEEHVAEALSSASLVDRLESEQYPEEPPQGEIPTPQRQVMSNPPETEKQITPASNIVPPPAAETSTPALQEQPPQGTSDLNLWRLKGYVNGELYSVNWVRLHLMHISRMPSALPSPTLWAVPGNLDVAKLVYDVVLSPGYVEIKWPVLQILLGTSVNNVDWAAGVLTTLALFDGITLLPYAGMQAK